MALGHEALRYFELADADERAVAQSPSTSGLPGWRRLSSPRHPSVPATGISALGTAAYRQMMEDLAEAPWDEDEFDRVRLLGWLDALDVTSRAELGDQFFEWRESVLSVDPGATASRARNFRLKEGRLRLSFRCCTHLALPQEHLFRIWAELHQYDQFHGSGTVLPNERIGVSVLLTPDFRAERTWDTTVIVHFGDPGITHEDAERYRAWLEVGSI